MRQRELFSSRPRSYWESIFSLIGHLIGTAVIFGALFVLGWLLSVLLFWLNTIHSFPPAILDIVTKIEVFLVYIDAGLCFVLLLAGAWRFCSELWELRR